MVALGSALPGVAVLPDEGAVPAAPVLLAAPVPATAPVLLAVPVPATAPVLLAAPVPATAPALVAAPVTATAPALLAAPVPATAPVLLTVPTAPAEFVAFVPNDELLAVVDPAKLPAPLALGPDEPAPEDVGSEVPPTVFDAPAFAVPEGPPVAVALPAFAVPFVALAVVPVLDAPAPLEFPAKTLDPEPAVELPVFPVAVEGLVEALALPLVAGPELPCAPGSAAEVPAAFALVEFEPVAPVEPFAAPVAFVPAVLAVPVEPAVLPAVPAVA